MRRRLPCRWPSDSSDFLDFGAGRSAAADRGEHRHLRAGREGGVQGRASALDEDVDVAPDGRPRIAQAIAHPRPAYVQRVDHLANVQT
jgi:hypothetical protein